MDSSNHTDLLLMYAAVSFCLLKSFLEHTRRRRELPVQEHRARVQAEEEAKGPTGLHEVAQETLESTGAETIARKRALEEISDRDLPVLAEALALPLHEQRVLCEHGSDGSGYHDILQYTMFRDYYIIAETGGLVRRMWT